MHVLGTPPAFILSQDQTLMFKSLELLQKAFLPDVWLSSFVFWFTVLFWYPFRLAPSGFPSSEILCPRPGCAPLGLPSGRLPALRLALWGLRLALPLFWNFQVCITVHLSRFIVPGRTNRAHTKRFSDCFMPVCCSR